MSPDTVIAMIGVLLAVVSIALPTWIYLRRRRRRCPDQLGDSTEEHLLPLWQRGKAPSAIEDVENIAVESGNEIVATPFRAGTVHMSSITTSQTRVVHFTYT
ncbi:hypothetical protein BJY00DRAFT_293843 [Aspergillus carlsbadensis]|nr:hypothetical protein BJY00DRAFT_293843 [Aspergillus carlsbadensis]